MTLWDKTLILLLLLGLFLFAKCRNENEVAAMTRSRLFHLYENICHPMDKCNTTAHFSDRTCFCDRFCSIMNDCCYDQHRKLTTSKRGIILLRNSLLCSEVEGLDDFHYYYQVQFYIIKSCPHNMENQTARRLCEDDFFDDDFLNLMAVSRVTGVLYRNMYCALCWGEFSAEFWRLEMDCPTNVITYPETDNSTIHLLDMKTNISRCTYQQIPPRIDDYNTLRRCDNTINSDCKSSWERTLIHQHCGLHSSYIRDAKTKRVYKNFHCALCNDVVVGELRCTTISELDLVYYPPRSVETSSATPVTRLFLNINNGEVATDDGHIYSMPECDMYHVYDPFQTRCRRLRCPKSHELTDDEECDDTRARQRAARKNLVDSFNNCSMFVYEPHQYVEKDNGTIRILSAFHDFDYGTYIRVNGSVYICRDVVRRLSKHMFPGLDGESVEGLVFTSSILVALIGVIIHGVFYFIAPDLRTLRGRCLMSLDSCLIISEGILIAGTSETRNRTTCVVAAVFLHYFILAAFFWKNIMAYDLVVTVWRKRRNLPPKNTRRFVAFCLYGWFLPATITGISIRLDQIPALHPFVPDYAHKWCWISNMEALLVVYLIPICLVLISDFTMNIITFIDIYHMIQDGVTDLGPNIADIIVHIKLSVFLGTTWLLTYFGSFSKSPILWYLFSVFNIGQGLYLAWIYAFNPSARKGAWQTIKNSFEAVTRAFQNFRRKRLKKNVPIHRKRKPTPVDV